MYKPQPLQDDGFIVIDGVVVRCPICKDYWKIHDWAKHDKLIEEAAKKVRGED